MKSKTKTKKKPLKTAVARKLVSQIPPSCKISAAEVSYSLDVKKEGIESIFGAAYLMMEKAYVSLSGDRGKTVGVVLRPKDPKALKLRALADEFLSDLEGQKIRWAVAKNNLPIREFIAEQAVLIVNGTVPPPAQSPAAPEQLSDDQRAEIEKLIAEVEAEIKTMNLDKTKAAVFDPKGNKASWEEKQERGNKS